MKQVLKKNVGRWPMDGIECGRLPVPNLAKIDRRRLLFAAAVTLHSQAAVRTLSFPFWSYL